MGLAQASQRYLDRVTFHQRRRTPAFRFVTRGDVKPQPDVPAGGAPVDDELSDGESSDDEFSDKELDDGESSDEETDDEPENGGGVGTPPPQDNTPPSTPVLPGTATSSMSTIPAPTQTAISGATDLPPFSSTFVSSPSIPGMATNTLSPSPSSLPSSAIPVVSPSATSVLNSDNLTTPTATASPQSTSNSPLEVPQSSNAIDPPDETTNSPSNSSQKAGQIAGGTIGGIAFVGLILLAIWLWRRRRNRDSRLSRMLPDDTQYMNPPPGGPEKSRSPSSIMNQLMTAAYAAEEGRDYRDSNQIFDNYANEKQRFTTHENESMERLTVPPAAQLRHQSIAARTESTEKTESTWKTWGVLAGSSRVSQPRNWWVDRYFRT
ncbi:hypothetical protein FHL15_001823 [Xylaria flabelliformis]|uniref:Uncharacterized protein n=1 Tax=Xylaria flabelliformis TaxID=2512241 RepID=A0A553IA05_9PEZI|nr:hypothetical protein FHL15_001823 [Xylaria flabelliformis]